MSPLCVQVNPYGQELCTERPDDGRVRPACRQLLGKPALPLARILHPVRSDDPELVVYKPVPKSSTVVLESS